MGTDFGRYEILDRIGVGGMAEVYRARAYGAQGFQKNLVLKKILPHLSDDPHFRSMFVDEAKIAVHLQHQNVVQILDLGRIDDQLFIAMELVEGADLARTFLEAARKSVPFPLGVALYIAKEALKGLHYAHTRAGSDGRPLKIIHRDVSPPNILLSMAGEVKISDFGIAKAAELTNSKTKTGIVKGKLHFMSPEQLKALTLDPRCDVWGMGMVLYTLIAGDHPFEGWSEVDIIDAIRAGNIAPPSAKNPGLPVSLDEIVMKALRVSREERYQTAEEFGAAVERFAKARQLFLDPMKLRRFMERVWDAEALANMRAEHGASTQASIVKRLAPERKSASDGDPSFTVLRTSPSGAIPAAPEGTGTKPGGPRQAENADATRVAPAAAPAGELSAPAGLLSEKLEGSMDAPSREVQPGSSTSPALPTRGGGLRWLPVAGIGAAALAATVSLAILLSPPADAPKDTPAPVVAPSPGMGLLDLDVAPWADVWIDGTRAGSTPLLKQLKPGTYRLDYETPDGKRHSTTVEIREGATNRIHLE